MPIAMPARRLAFSQLFPRGNTVCPATIVRQASEAIGSEMQLPMGLSRSSLGSRPAAASLSKGPDDLVDRAPRFHSSS